MSSHKEFIDFDRLGDSRTLHQDNGVSGTNRGVINPGQTQGRSGVNSYFRRNELALMRYHWQVIWLS